MLRPSGSELMSKGRKSPQLIIRRDEDQGLVSTEEETSFRSNEQKVYTISKINDNKVIKSILTSY